MKHSKDTVGKTFTFKVQETTEEYYVLTTVLEKKPKIAVVPKVLSQFIGRNVVSANETQTIEGYLIGMHGKIPIVTLNPLVVQLSDLVP